MSILNRIKSLPLSSMSQIRKIKDMKTTKKGSSGNITPLKKVVTVVDKEEVISV